MRKTCALVMLILSMAVILSSCGGATVHGNTPTVKEKSYTSMEERESLDEFKDSAVLGISPDGKYVIVSTSDSISVIDLDEREVKESMDSEEAAIGAKTALWSNTGEHFILGDATYTGNELKRMKSFNFCTYTLEDGTQVTDENVDESIMKGGDLLYSPTWSADGKSVIYSSANDKGIKIVKVDVKSKNETVLYQTKDRSGFEQAIELKNGLLLCEFNGAKRGDNRLFLYDIKKEEKKDIDGIVENEDAEIPFFYEIKGWSDDRRTVLINKLANGQFIHKSFILKFDQSFKEYEVEELEYQVLGQDGKFLVMNDKAEKRIAYSTLLSSGGRYLISREDEVLEEKDSIILESNRQLVLHDLVQDKEFILYETRVKEPFGISNPLNKNCAPLFLTDNGLLMVWFMEGYKLFELKP